MGAVITVRDSAGAGRFRAAVLAAALALAAAAWPAGSQAHTNARFYRGDITASTSWEGVIRLTGTVTIREGVTVTIEPGTEVLVQPAVGADIIVRGRLLVRGAPSKPVLFDTAGGCGAGPWGGIVFLRGASGVFENVTVRCSQKGIGGETGGVRATGVTLVPPTR